MRTRWVAIGLAILVVGLALSVVPFPAQSTGSSATTPVILGYKAPLDVLDPAVGYTVTWNATQPVTLEVFACGTDSNCSASHLGSQPIVSAAGASGTLTFAGQANRYYDVTTNLTANPTTATVTITYTAPLLGGIVGWVAIGVGAVVAVAGGLLPARIEPEESQSDEG